MNSRDVDDRTAGHWAAAYGCAECLEVLVKSGWDVNSRDYYDMSAGHLAAIRRCAKSLDTWIKLGGDVYLKNTDGETVRDLAMRDKKCKKVVEKTG